MRSRPRSDLCGSSLPGGEVTASACFVVDLLWCVDVVGVRLLGFYSAVRIRVSPFLLSFHLRRCLVDIFLSSFIDRFRGRILNSIFQGDETTMTVTSNRYFIYLEIFS